MKKDTKEAQRGRLVESLGELTEENQRHFLGVLEALAFAQNMGEVEGKADKTSQEMPA
jgi:hypothetical protein